MGQLSPLLQVPLMKKGHQSFFMPPNLEGPVDLFLPSAGADGGAGAALQGWLVALALALA